MMSLASRNGSMPAACCNRREQQKNSAACQPGKNAFRAGIPTRSLDRRRTSRGDQRPAGCALSQVRNCWNNACFAASVRLALTAGLVCARN